MVRLSRHVLPFAVLVAALPLSFVTGCSGRGGDCALNYEPCAGGNGGAGGGGGSGNGGSGGSSCDPTSPNFKSDSTCGVFLAPTGDDGAGDGSPAAPYKTLQFASVQASGKPIFACEGTYEGGLVSAENIEFYGGMKCLGGTWAQNLQGRTVVKGPDAGPAMELSVGISHFEGLRIEPAVGYAGLFAHDGATVELFRSDIESPAGSVGMAGESAPDDLSLDGVNGSAGTPAPCAGGSSTPGGPGGDKACGLVSLTGGVGGTGTNMAMGGKGGDGVPQPGPNLTEGIGGDGQSGAQCKDGAPGFIGDDGVTGAGGQGLGTLNSNGFLPPVGGSGLPGAFGGGGGGGGGAKLCPVGGGRGASGGGGGSGGCGGQVVGQPGLPGKSSLGILSVNSLLSLDGVSVTVADGGKGGTGGDGQTGGKAGSKGLAAAGQGACNGGNGGKGGRAGGGGGGAGGLSVALAFVGMEPTLVQNVTLKRGAPGVGGAGGNASLDPVAKGAGGLACTLLNFATGDCTP